ncbi:hypothetical protein DTO164E3_8169 [Paecilomyces variotii]|nr:hypothetical protein DTO164E3_8169 [Paecilomyces variotii]
MSLVYRERDREWDDYSGRSDPRSSHTTVRRYVIPPEEERERDVVYRREDPVTGDRELVIRRSTERDDRDYDRDYKLRLYERSERDYYDREYSQSDGLRRYSRSTEYLARPESAPQPIIIHERQPIIIHEARGPIYVSPREEPEYQVIHKTELVDREPRDREYYYQRRVREYDDERRSRRELSPEDSISERERDRRDQDYSSDDSMVYVRKETREYNGSPHRRHLAEGALLGAGAAELLRHHNKKEGNVSHGIGRVGRDVGGAALGAIAAGAIERARSHHRSRSRRRSESVDWDRGSHRRHHHRPRYRSRSRSSSHSRAKTLAELGLGAAALAGVVALARNKSKSRDGRERRSRSRHRRGSSPSDGGSEDDTRDDARNPAHRNKRMAEAGLAGAAVAGLIERHRSKSRSRRGERSRSRSKIRQALPVIAAGLGSAAVAGLYEKNKAKKENEEARPRRSRSRSRSRSGTYPDATRDSGGLIEYGDRPVYGNIPEADYYGRPPSPDGYYSDAIVPAATGAAAYGASRHRRRHRSPSRDSLYSSDAPDSDRSPRRRHRHKHHSSRSRSRHLAEAALAAAAGGFAADQYAKKKERKRAEKERRRHESDEDYDPYEDQYDPDPYTPPPPPAGAGPYAGDHHYPQTNSFPPPPGSAPVPPQSQPAPYNPGEYPPPPSAAPPPPQPYGYQPPPGPDPYAPRPRRADENVSAAPSPIPPTDAHHMVDGLRGKPPLSAASISQPPSSTNREVGEGSHHERSSQPKTVAFDLPSDSSQESDRSSEPDTGYETDDSEATIDGSVPSHRRGTAGQHHRGPVSHSPTPHPEAHSPSRSHKHRASDKTAESDSDSTIDLPPRFDSQGRPIPQPDDDPLADHIEKLLNGIGSVLLR